MQKNHSTRTLQLLCAKKVPQKNTKYWRKKTILKIDHLAKAIAHAKCQFWSKIKNAKTCKTLFYKNPKVVPCKKKNGSKKHQILEK